MNETKTNLLSGLKNFFIEEDPVSESQPPSNVPVSQTVATTSLPPPTVTSQVAASQSLGFSEEELQKAQATIATWSNFTNLQNLKKFASIEAKLKTKISDPVALRVASFEMAEVAGIDKAAVLREAESAVKQVQANLTVALEEQQKQLNVYDNQMKVSKQSLETELAALEQNIIKLRETLTNLPAEIASVKAKLQNQASVTQQVATLFVEQWSPLIESKKS